jgi:hypothetical protein
MTNEKLEKFVELTKKELRTYDRRVMTDDAIQKFEDKFWECYNDNNMPHSNIDAEGDIDAIPEFTADAYVSAVLDGEEDIFFKVLFGE